MGRTRVGILFGGRSAEHEVSLRSARNIVRAIDRSVYDVVLIAIDRDGRWWMMDEDRFERLFDAIPPSQPPAPPTAGDPLCVLPGAGNGAFRCPTSTLEAAVDVVFPALHGPFGEDGTVQGLLMLADLPFVGPGVLGSAVCMDKDVMKRLLKEASIPTPRFGSIDWSERGDAGLERLAEELGLPLFVKPANMGSSVGISKAGTPQELERAVDAAFRYDTKIIVEEFIQGREIECSVLGNERPTASLPGEVKPLHEFYSYEAKYEDERGALLEIPAKLTESQTARVRELAVRAFRTLGCEGMARVDFFLTGDDRVLVNELNTLPGFTDISMYPKLWEASGVGPGELIDRLIGLALERHERGKRLATSRFR